jgi:hypothetical protein
LLNYPFFLKFSIRKWIILIILSFLIACFRPVSGLSPSWFKEGVYAKYETRHSILFSNHMLLFQGSQLAFQWKCIKLDGTIAELNVSVAVDGTTKFSAIVYVNIESREVNLPNGTYLGKTWLWLPANPSDNQTLELANNQTVQAKISGVMDTCQGPQKSFIAVNGFGGGGYDLDTGIAIQPDLREEPTLLAIGILDMDGPTIVDTNIDLGPRELWIDLVKFLIFISPAIPFIIVFAFLYYRREKKKRRKIALAAKKQKVQTPS